MLRAVLAELGAGLGSVALFTAAGAGLVELLGLRRLSIGPRLAYAYLLGIAWVAGGLYAGSHLFQLPLNRTSTLVLAALPGISRHWRASSGLAVVGARPQRANRRPHPPSGPGPSTGAGRSRCDPRRGAGVGGHSRPPRRGARQPAHRLGRADDLGLSGALPAGRGNGRRPGAPEGQVVHHPSAVSRPPAGRPGGGARGLRRRPGRAAVPAPLRRLFSRAPPRPLRRCQALGGTAGRRLGGARRRRRPLPRRRRGRGGRRLQRRPPGLLLRRRPPPAPPPPAALGGGDRRRAPPGRRRARQERRVAPRRLRPRRGRLGGPPPGPPAPAGDVGEVGEVGANRPGGRSRPRRGPPLLLLALRDPQPPRRGLREIRRRRALAGGGHPHPHAPADRPLLLFLLEPLDDPLVGGPGRPRRRPPGLEKKAGAARGPRLAGTSHDRLGGLLGPHPTLLSGDGDLGPDADPRVDPLLPPLRHGAPPAHRDARVRRASLALPADRQVEPTSGSA